MELHISIAQRLIPFALLFIALLLFGLIGLLPFEIFMFGLAAAFLWLIVPTEIGSTANTRKADRFWLWIAALAVNAVFFFVAYLLIGWMFYSTGIGYGANFMSGLMSSMSGSGYGY
jgi:uncharacterized membrane-anchored protein YitT (DUF2179 family)